MENETQSISNLLLEKSDVSLAHAVVREADGTIPDSLQSLCKRTFGINPHELTNIRFPRIAQQLGLNKVWQSNDNDIVQRDFTELSNRFQEGNYSMANYRDYHARVNKIYNNLYSEGERIGSPRIDNSRHDNDFALACFLSKGNLSDVFDLWERAYDYTPDKVKFEFRGKVVKSVLDEGEFHFRKDIVEKNLKDFEDIVEKCGEPPNEYYVLNSDGKRLLDEWMPGFERERAISFVNKKFEDSYVYRIRRTQAVFGHIVNQNKIDLQAEYRNELTGRWLTVIASAYQDALQAGEIGISGIYEAVVNRELEKGPNPPRIPELRILANFIEFNQFIHEVQNPHLYVNINDIKIKGRTAERKGIYSQDQIIERAIRLRELAEKYFGDENIGTETEIQEKVEARKIFRNKYIGGQTKIARLMYFEALAKRNGTTAKLIIENPNKALNLTIMQITDNFQELQYRILDRNNLTPKFQAEVSKNALGGNTIVYSDDQRKEYRSYIINEDEFKETLGRAVERIKSCRQET